MPGVTFPRAVRLRKRHQYDLVRNQGRTTRGAFFRLSYCTIPNSETVSQFGIIASRRVGGAVIRNQVKRRFRDLYRHEQDHVLSGLWIVIVATPQAATASKALLHAEWRRLGKKLSLFKEEITSQEHFQKKCTVS